MILVIIRAIYDFLINSFFPISYLEANLFKYEVFLGVRVGKDEKILHANMPRSVTFET